MHCNKIITYESEDNIVKLTVTTTAPSGGTFQMTMTTTALLMCRAVSLSRKRPLKWNMLTIHLLSGGRMMAVLFLTVTATWFKTQPVTELGDQEARS